MQVLWTIGQVLGALVALAGLYMLAGPAWTALVGGAFLLGVFSLGDWVASRPRQGGV